jgi:phage terminase small subunit
MARNGTLTAKQSQFVAALMTTPTVERAAAVAGISTRTAWRWLRLPEVQAALRDVQDETLRAATRQAVAAIGMAVATLEAVMANPGAPAGAKVSAARTILDAAAKLTETADLARRISDLEARL